MSASHNVGLFHQDATFSHFATAGNVLKPAGRKATKCTPKIWLFHVTDCKSQHCLHDISLSRYGHRYLPEHEGRGKKTPQLYWQSHVSACKKTLVKIFTSLTQFCRMACCCLHPDPEVNFSWVGSSLSLLRTKDLSKGRKGSGGLITGLPSRWHSNTAWKRPIPFVLLQLNQLAFNKRRTLEIQPSKLQKGGGHSRQTFMNAVKWILT